MGFKPFELPDGRVVMVPRDHTVMAMDEDGRWFTYQKEPHIDPDFYLWIGGFGFYEIPSDELHEPFEPGPWTEQLYEI